jgi:hypothetical protein
MVRTAKERIAAEQDRSVQPRQGLTASADKGQRKRSESRKALQLLCERRRAAEQRLGPGSHLRRRPRSSARGRHLRRNRGTPQRGVRGATDRRGAEEGELNRIPLSPNAWRRHSPSGLDVVQPSIRIVAPYAIAGRADNTRDAHGCRRPRVEHIGERYTAAADTSVGCRAHADRAAVAEEEDRDFPALSL